jgi:hypothetical protein
MKGMRMLKRLLPALLVIALFGGSVVTIGAQSEEPTQHEDIAGLQKAYSRQFTIDNETMMGMATPGATLAGWYALSAVILEFDTEDHATAGLDLVLAELTKSDLSGQDAQMEDIELDVDFAHVAMRDVAEASGLTRANTNVLLAAAQDDRYVYLVVSLAFDEDPETAVTSTLAGIADADVSDDPEIFRQDGTSEGGLWAKFPSLEAVQADAPALTEAIDETVYPEPSSAIGTPVRVQVTPVTVGTPAG